MSEVKRYWIYKGTSNFCQVLTMNDDYTDMVKQKPDGFYDIVSTNDTVEGGVEVVLASEYEKLKAQLEKAEAIVKAYADAVKDQTVNVSIPYDDLDPDDFDIIEEFESGEPNDFGEKAREYFKEINKGESK